MILLFNILFPRTFEKGDIPIQENGRIKPLDSFARNHLLAMHSKRSLKASALPKNLDIDIYVNNQFAQNLKLKHSNNFKDKKIQILLDNKFIEDDKEIKIDFNIKNPISPMEILESPDSRKLGILLKSIELKLI